MRTLRLVAVGSLLFPAAALAESPQDIEENVPDVQGWMVSERVGGIQSIRQVLPRTGPIAHAGETLILYINKNGVTLSPGNNDARTNRSTLVGQATAVPAWNVSAGDWAQIMDCTRTMWAPFNVLVTDVDPGNVPHMESVVTTFSSTIGMDPNVGGVSPYTIGCDVIPNSVVFTFAEAFGGDPETICEVMGQEMAHSVGLDHQMLASDPMTYLQYNGRQAFRDETVSCGEYENRACGLEGECGASQNSYRMLIERVGPGGGGGGEGIPSIEITSPSQGANVPRSFNVTTDASDDGTVTSVELWVDGALVETRSSAPWSFSVSDLIDGSHSLQTIVYDDAGQSATAQINVTVSADAPDPDGDGGNPDDPSPSELVGGCAASSGAGASSLVLLGLALLGLRRRRHQTM